MENLIKKEKKSPRTPRSKTPAKKQTQKSKSPAKSLSRKRVDHQIKDEPVPAEQAPKKGFCDIEKLDKSKIKSVLQNIEEPELGKRAKQTDENFEK